ncbi:tetratricopeptide repeat protein [Flavobacterium sp.]|jgi:tetratricopeptide (TPR) repeat protein|uniref:tetratricopeptide repeat protein n=1 Tax=Flavobacterium sp. TaxID=239 RepID=UPI0037BE9903
MIKIITLLSILILSNCFGQATIQEVFDKKTKQEAIIKESLENGAWRHMLFSKEWQDEIDLGLKKDSTIAYLWQQKAMPYFKLRKCEIGMPFINKAVQYDAKRWQPYRAFIKCIFARTYKEAIIDFEDCIKKFGNNYEMDHTYSFYLGLCYLQLNEYEKAEKYFKEYVEDLFQNRQGLEHHTALFYYGIAKYELQNFEEAIVEFDKALKIYSNFSDVKFYKAMCFMKINKEKEAMTLLEEGKMDAEKGYTINEDNAIYEKYPYQVIWK